MTSTLFHSSGETYFIDSIDFKYQWYYMILHHKNIFNKIFDIKFDTKDKNEDEDEGEEERGN